MSGIPIDAPILRQSVQWGENYVSRALNAKLAGVLKPGVYSGFVLKPGGIMTVLVEHGPDAARSVAVVERDGFSVTVTMDDPGRIAIPAKGIWYVCIEACYIPTQQGYQRIVARESPEPHHVILGKVLADSDVVLTEPLSPDSIVTEDVRTDTGMATQDELNRVLKILASLTNQLIRLATRLTSVELQLAAGAEPGEGVGGGSITMPDGTVIGLAGVGTRQTGMGDLPVMFVLEEKAPPTV